MPRLQVGTESNRPSNCVTDYGTGKPVVLIHGWPLSGRSWENHVPALPDTYNRPDSSPPTSSPGW